MAKIKTSENQSKSKRVMPKGRLWKKGQSGNPAGRPRKDVCLTSKLKDLVDDPLYRSVLEELQSSVPEIPDGITFGQMVALKLWLRAADGDLAAIKEVMDRIDGRTTEHVRMAGAVVALKVVYLADENQSADTWERECQERSTIDERRKVAQLVK